MKTAAPSPIAPVTPVTALPACGASRAHESAAAQVAGAAPYIDDIPEVRGTLHAAPILSPVAHGRLQGVDTRAALAMPGVRDVVLARDIPGDPILAAFAHDEPIFALDTVQHVGQVIGLVVADTVMQARRAARKVVLDIEALPAVLTVHAGHGRAKLRAAARDREARRRGSGPGARHAHAARPVRGRRPGALLPGGPDRLRAAAGAGPVAGVLQHPAPRRGPALGVACAGPGQPPRAGGMPAHGRRLRRQGNAGRPPGGVGGHRRATS